MTRHAVLPLANACSTLTLAHINDSHGRCLPLMNALGFQFLALGNHDFDDGAEPVHIEGHP